MRVVGIFVIVLFGLMMAINGALMLASPRVWFRLPRWLGVHGSLTEDRYATGWGAIQVRIAGGLSLAGIIWVLCNMFLRRA